MILTCPECDTRFLVNAAALEPEGRTVRCSKCEHTWHQDPEPPNREEAEDEETGEAEAVAVEQPEVEPAPESVTPIPEGSGLPALPAEGEESLRYFGMSFAGVFVGILLILLVLRSTVVGAWEPGAGFYDMIGMSAPIRGTGLAFGNLKALEHKTRDGRVLIVEGLITNMSDKPQDIPPLRVSLMAGPEVLMEKVLESKKARTLKAGQTTKFQTRMSNPAPGSITARLSVVP